MPGITSKIEKNSQDDVIENSTAAAQSPRHWGEYQRRYASGEERAVIFLDMVRDEARKLALSRSTANSKTNSILEIGCGGGFDHKPRLQEQLSILTENYIGIEPDTEIELDPSFTETHRCLLEETRLESNSISLATSVMVLEHVENAEDFWSKIYDLLEPGGVFWGFTVDARHWFVTASSLLERTHLKTLYLNLLHGKRGENRYENYGVFYRTNSPEDIYKLTAQFSSTDIVSFQKIGQLDFYLPKWLHWLSRIIDRFEINRRKPGPVIAIRVEK